MEDPWTLYHHFPENADWSMAGYDVVLADIRRTDVAAALTHRLSDAMILHTMWFLIRGPVGQVEPRWEHPACAGGGYWQYRVPNSCAPEVWRETMMACFGGQLESTMRRPFLGASISPRGHFCVIRLWYGKERTTAECVPLSETPPALPSALPSTGRGKIHPPLWVSK